MKDNFFFSSPSLIKNNTFVKAIFRSVSESKNRRRTERDERKRKRGWCAVRAYKRVHERGLRREGKEGLGQAVLDSAQLPRLEV